MKTKPVGSGAPHATAQAPASASAVRRRPHPLAPSPSSSASASAAAAASSASDHQPPPEKDISHSKYAGISPESVQCMSEQISIENITEEACAALAEDLSYKLRQLIHNVALHARHKKSPRVEVEDVNIVLKLMDTEPILGPSPPQWVPIGETENLCTTVDPVVDLVELATQSQTLVTLPPPSLSVSWVTDNKSTSGNNTLSSNLQNYYHKIARALLSGNQKLVRVALRDLSTNTHIGPIIPNLINLTLLVLSESSLTPMSHEILHKQALNILDSLLINPCCYDTDVYSQLNRLFPILVSNVLTESILSDQILRIILLLVTIWSQYAFLGRSAVLDYLSKGVEERLTGPLVECLTALGRKALVDGLTFHMPLIEGMSNRLNDKIYRPGLYEAILNASYVFLKVSNKKYDPQNAFIDEHLYEILGDAVIPRRIQSSMSDESSNQSSSAEKSPYANLKSSRWWPRTKVLKYFPKCKDNMHYYDTGFDYSNPTLGYGLLQPPVRFNVSGFRQMQVHKKKKYVDDSAYRNVFQNGNRYSLDKKLSVIVANGALLRFKYKLPNERRVFPNYSFYTL